MAKNRGDKDYRHDGKKVFLKHINTIICFNL